MLPKKAGWGNAVRFRVTVSPLRPSFASLSGHCQCPPRLKLKCECIVESVRNIERNFWMNMSGDIIETLTVAGIYDLRRLQSSAAGGSAQGPSSRLTVARLSPEMSTWNFFREIYHPKCPGDHEAQLRPSLSARALPAGTGELRPLGANPLQSWGCRSAVRS